MVTACAAAAFLTNSFNSVFFLFVSYLIVKHHIFAHFFQLSRCTCLSFIAFAAVFKLPLGKCTVNLIYYFDPFICYCFSTLSCCCVHFVAAAFCFFFVLCNIAWRMRGAIFHACLITPPSVVVHTYICNLCSAHLTSFRGIVLEECEINGRTSAFTRISLSSVHLTVGQQFALNRFANRTNSCLINFIVN